MQLSERVQYESKIDLDQWQKQSQQISKYLDKASFLADNELITSRDKFQTVEAAKEDPVKIPRQMSYLSSPQNMNDNDYTSKVQSLMKGIQQMKTQISTRSCESKFKFF